MIWAIIFVGLLLLAGLVAWARPKIRQANAEAEAFSARYRERAEEIAALSFEEARRQAEILLADPGTFECVLAPSPADTPDALAPGLQTLFSRYASIWETNGEVTLDRALIAPFGGDWDEGPWRRHQFWQIGEENGGHVVVLVEPHQEGVYVTDGIDEKDADWEKPDYPSVYHYLLMTASDFRA